MFKQIIKPGFAEVTEFCQHAHGNGAVKILLNIGYRRSYGFVNGARHFKICSGKHSVAQGVKLRNGVKNFKPVIGAVLNNPAEKGLQYFPYTCSGSQSPAESAQVRNLSGSF